MTERLDDVTTILVVDDVAEIRTFIVRILEREGYRTAQAGHGLEALEQLVAGGIHIMITDLVMPEMNGVDLIHRVKDEYPELFVIATTGEAVNLDIQDALDSGALICIRKPFSREHLLEKIRDLDMMRQRRVVRQETHVTSNEAAEMEVVHPDQRRNLGVLIVLIVIAVTIAIVIGTHVFTDHGDESGAGESELFPGQ